MAFTERALSVISFTFIVACVIVLVKDHASDSETVISTPGSSTQLDVSPTEMWAAPKEASGFDWSCTNVLDWNFFDAKLVHSNLGGKGDSVEDCQLEDCKGSGPEELRYEGVYKKHGVSMGDLVVTVVGDYTVKNTQINGLNGAFGTINVQSNSESRFKFRLVKTGTDELLPVTEEDKVLFSVYDLDAGKAKAGGVAHEYCEFNTPVVAHKLTDTTTVATSGTNDHLKAWSTRSGTAADNPADPLKMSKIATDSKISVTYQGTAEWEFTYGSKGENIFKSEKNKRLGYPNGVRQTGRNLLFAGRSQGDCACVGVSHWKIQNNLVHNNLGGKGPNTADPPELRFSDVFGLAPYSWAEVGPVDLVITVADGESYQPADGDGIDGAGKNGLWPVGHSDHQQMVGINIKCSTQTKFDFRFVKHGTDEPYTVSNTFFSLYDLDQSKESNDPGNHEYCEFPQGPDFHPQGWKTTADTQLKQSATDGETLKFESTEWGKLDDNPTDPTKLTELQKSRSVTVWYSATSHFQVTLGDYGPRCAAKGGGRNMLFAGPGIYCPAN